MGENSLSKKVIMSVIAESTRSYNGNVHDVAWKMGATGGVQFLGYPKTVAWMIPQKFIECFVYGLDGDLLPFFYNDLEESQLEKFINVKENK